MEPQRAGWDLDVNLGGGRRSAEEQGERGVWSRTRDSNSAGSGVVGLVASYPGPNEGGHALCSNSKLDGDVCRRVPELLVVLHLQINRAIHAGGLASQIPGGEKADAIKLATQGSVHA